MAVLAEFRFRPIQVLTPMKKSNPRNGEKDQYETDLFWELNEDNEPDFENRCVEPKSRNFTAMLKRESIRKYVSTYQYSAADVMAKELGEDLPEDVRKLIAIGRERLKLNLREVDKLLKGLPNEIIPVLCPNRSDDQRSVFEYALALEIKIKKEEYADFIRALTPLTFELVERILKLHGGVDINDYCRIRKIKLEKQNKEIEERRFDRNKLEGTEVMDILQKAFNGSFTANFVAETVLQTLTKRILLDLEEAYPEESYDPEDLVYSMARFYQKTKTPFVIIIDEWDAVFRERKEDKEGQLFYLDFLRDWLKDKESVPGVWTGL